jgi:hypothetical protein
MIINHSSRSLRRKDFSASARAPTLREITAKCAHGIQWLGMVTALRSTVFRRRNDRDLLCGLSERTTAMDRRSLLLLLSALPLARRAAAAEPEIYTGIVEGTGAGGFDVVSYQSGNPVAGKPEFAATWKDAKWLFTTAENKTKFEAAPEKYAPQYGGYCAFAVAKGATAKGDPEAWSVVDGKLYLNLSQSIREQWRTDIPGHIAAANANWPGVLE